MLRLQSLGIWLGIDDLQFEGPNSFARLPTVFRPGKFKARFRPCPQDSSPLGIPRLHGMEAAAYRFTKTRTEELERRSFVDDVRYKDPGGGAAGKPPSRPPSPPELLLAVLLPPSFLGRTFSRPSSSPTPSSVAPNPRSTGWRGTATGGWTPASPYSLPKPGSHCPFKSSSSPTNTPLPAAQFGNFFA
jgi:hypothetical protein